MICGLILYYPRINSSQKLNKGQLYIVILSGCLFNVNRFPFSAQRQGQVIIGASNYGYLQT